MEKKLRQHYSCHTTQAPSDVHYHSGSRLLPCTATPGTTSGPFNFFVFDFPSNSGHFNDLHHKILETRMFSPFPLCPVHRSIRIWYGWSFWGLLYGNNTQKHHNIIWTLGFSSSTLLSLILKQSLKQRPCKFRAAVVPEPGKRNKRGVGIVWSQDGASLIAFLMTHDK